VPDHLTTMCVDIAIYRMALSADVLTTEHRTRYEDALSTLKKIAEGKASLAFTPVAPAPGEPAVSTSPKPIVVGGPERLFSRDQMRGL
jgi:phage gp36-like protein